MKYLMPNYDKWFYLDDGDSSQYVVVDSSQTIYYHGVKKDGYTHSFGIWVKKQEYMKRRIYLTPVTTDFKAFVQGKPLTEIDYSAVPDNIRRIWKRELKKIEEFYAGKP